MILPGKLESVDIFYLGIISISFLLYTNDDCHNNHWNHTDNTNICRAKDCHIRILRFSKISEYGKCIGCTMHAQRKMDMQNKEELPQQKNIATVKKSIIRQIKVEQKSVLAETKRLETERPPQPKPSVLASKYPSLREIDSRLKEQNRAIFEREKKRDRLKKELSECTGIFKSGRRKELQQEINSVDNQISNMKKRLSSIVREYKFDSVQAFYKEFDAAKKENLEYQAARAEYDKIYGEKAVDTMSVREKLRQKEKIVKEREAGRVHQARQKDKGAR